MEIRRLSAVLKKCGKFYYNNDMVYGMDYGATDVNVISCFCIDINIIATNIGIKFRYINIFCYLIN